MSVSNIARVNIVIVNQSRVAQWHVNQPRKQVDTPGQSNCGQQASPRSSARLSWRRYSQRHTEIARSGVDNRAAIKRRRSRHQPGVRQQNAQVSKSGVAMTVSTNGPSTTLSCPSLRRTSAPVAAGMRPPLSSMRPGAYGKVWLESNRERPFDEDARLQVTDGRGEPYTPLNPSGFTILLPMGVKWAGDASGRFFHPLGSVGWQLPRLEQCHATGGYLFCDIHGRSERCFGPRSALLSLAAGSDRTSAANTE
jgi:hypothetical protein